MLQEVESIYQLARDVYTCLVFITVFQPSLKTVDLATSEAVLRQIAATKQMLDTDLRVVSIHQTNKKLIYFQKGLSNFEIDRNGSIL